MPRAAKGTQSEAAEVTTGSNAKATESAGKATTPGSNAKEAPAKKAAASAKKAAPAKKTASKKAAPAKKATASAKKAAPAKKAAASAKKAAPAKKAAASAKKAAPAKKTASKKVAPAKKGLETPAKKPSPAAKRASSAKAGSVAKAEEKQANEKHAEPPKMTAAEAKQAAKAAALAASPLAPVRSNAAGSAPLPSGLAASVAAAPVEKPKFTAQWLRDQRHKLIEARAEYEAQAVALKEEADAMARDMEPGDTQFDDESGEGGTQAIDRERDLALAARASAEVEEINRAIERLDLGTYGECERCGAPIPAERLEFIPEAPLCVSCKTGGLAVRR